MAPYLLCLGAPEPLAKGIEATEIRRLAAGRAVVRDTAALAGVLDAAGIRHVIVKGVVLAAAVGDQPVSRGAGDIDVWVRPEQVAEAELQARDHGWRRRPVAANLPQPDDTWRWRTFVRLAHEQPLDHPTFATFDLHWRLAQHQPELGFGFDDAYRRSIPVPTIGPTVRTLRLDDALVHLAQHGRKEAWPTLRHLHDVVRLVEACGPDTVGDLARAHRNVALALVTAANIDPSLSELASDADGRTRALADEAWKGCLSLELPLNVRRRLTGRTALEARFRHESWLARSAPTWATRRSWAFHLAVPLRRIVEVRSAHS